MVPIGINNQLTLWSIKILVTNLLSPKKKKSIIIIWLVKERTGPNRKVSSAQWTRALGDKKIIGPK